MVASRRRGWRLRYNSTHVEQRSNNYHVISPTSLPRGKFLFNTSEGQLIQCFSYLLFFFSVPHWVVSLAPPFLHWSTVPQWRFHTSSSNAEITPTWDPSLQEETNKAKATEQISNIAVHSQYPSTWFQGLPLSWRACYTVESVKILVQLPFKPVFSRRSQGFCHPCVCGEPPRDPWCQMLWSTRCVRTETRRDVDDVLDTKGICRQGAETCWDQYQAPLFLPNKTSTWHVMVLPEK